ncbi:ShlB/FhaC/HecB family hemolysin secretion/activation protein [Conservatibacter flavescens]|uniref:Peptide transporter n=1 Tax=Conservatibacter flavescens TaxID=28161 RepID=A0A2M8S2U8_9PAST|nr:ShlB/FhaC/HecB family hemolysin secretion/activation protein [Conservatibacter flavescens]PJG85466.1 peptide transporter [Conservatibacter flavescens]
MKTVKGILFFAISISIAVAAEPELNRLDAQAQQRSQQQIEQRAEQLIPQADVRFEQPTASHSLLPVNETPCYPIHQIQLIDYSDQQTTTQSKFQWALSRAIKQLNLTLPHCFGGEGLGVLMKEVQNQIIEKGYVTTRVLAQEQDLTQGVFSLTVVPGIVGRTIVADSSPVPRFTRLHSWTGLAFSKGKILNVRDIEQSLENLKRVPTADANIEILPSTGDDAILGESDLNIHYQQQFPFRLNLSLDDSGSKTTGKWQGSATLSLDNPFSANDLFYASFTHSLKRHTDEDGTRGSKSTALYYSIPFGYWQFSAFYSDSRYHQEVFGAFDNNYLYAGQTQNTKLTLSYMLYRDSARKTTLSGSFWSRHSKNYVDNSEIGVQRRRMSGWEAGFNHKEYFNTTTLELRANYKRGTGARGALPANEEMWGEGTSRPKIITAGLDITQPFSIGSQSLIFNTSWSAQWNKTRLIQQDKMSIGGRYTVRGFDGELTLSGERGWLWRNDLSWNIAHKGQWLYLALDGGRVTGHSDGMQLGHHLMGTAIGLRGGWKYFNYDFFIGRPLRKPEGFRTSNTVTGFNVGISF